MDSILKRRKYKLEKRTYELVKNKIAYAWAPKCGSRSILGYGCEINSDQRLSLEEVKKINVNVKSIKMCTRIDIKSFPIRFCVVRDPVERFLSAYMNKIFSTRDEYITGPISIEEILDTIDDPKYEMKYKIFLAHLVPQVFYYEEIPEKFTHIFNMRQFLQIKELLEGESGIKLFEFWRNKSNEEAKPKLSSSQIEFISKRYKKDYEIYGKWM